MNNIPKYYLDYNSTSSIPIEVEKAASPFIGAEFGNPSSKINPKGKKANEAVTEARAAIAELLGVKSAEIIFTSGGTESCYSALIGRVLAANNRAGRIVISAIEHPAVIEAAKLLAELFPVEVIKIAVDSNGQLDLNQLEQALTADTHIVSVMAANNETGVMPQLAEVVALARKKNIPVHTDATNLVGKVDLNFSELGVSFVSMSAHKIGGLKGVGILAVIGEENIWKPYIKGGGQESGRRGGTENVAGIVSLGAAATLKKAAFKRGYLAELKKQRDQFEKLVQEKIAEVKINGAAVTRLPNTSSIIFKNTVATELILKFAEQEIYVSAGSACKTGSVEISHVLKAMNVLFSDALSTIRFSFGHILSESDLVELVTQIADIVGQNRAENMALVREVNNSEN